MSQEILTALSQEAISRMSPYQLVEQAVGLRTRIYNSLDIEPVEQENGSTLYTVTSGLVATCDMQQETVVEGDELVRKQYAPLPLTAFADVVELRPPTTNTDGDARLYSIEKSVHATPTEARLPFHAAAVELITTPDPVYRKMSPVRFDGITNRFYRPDPDITYPDETYISCPSSKESHFARITHTSVLYRSSGSSNPLDTIDWTDGTAAFIESLSDRINHMMPLDTQSSYQQTLRTARQIITEVLSADHESTLGNIGCLAVAAQLAKPPATIPGTNRVDAAFFDNQ